MGIVDKHDVDDQEIIYTTCTLVQYIVYEIRSIESVTLDGIWGKEGDASGGIN